METFEKQTFDGDVISVDGKQFKTCRFVNVTFVYAGGQLPTFTNCQFSGVSLQFEGPAARTVRYLNGLHRGGFSAAVTSVLDGIRGKTQA